MKARRHKAAWLAGALLAACTSAAAGPGYYLVGVYDSPGQASIDYRYWHVKRPAAGNLPRTYVYAPEIGVGYNVGGSWYTEVYAMYLNLPNTDTRFNSLNWQNDLLLTRGQYPFDLAIHSNVARYDDRTRGYGVEVGPVMQTEWYRVHLNGGLFVERDVRAKAANPTLMKYQWEAKYRFSNAFELGLQGYGELGQWDRWLGSNLRGRRAGPVVSGVLPLFGDQSLQYELTYLTGNILDRRVRNFNARLQYLFD